MNKEQLANELKTYFSGRTDADKEAEFKKILGVPDALLTLNKLNKEEWSILYDIVFKTIDLVIDTIVEYPNYPVTKGVSNDIDKT